MNTKSKNSRVLRDLIRIGVFSALWIVVSFLIACTMGFFLPLLMVMPCILGVVGGIIYIVMLSKLTISGGMVISSGLLGVCLFTMAPYGMMFFCTWAGGIIGEIIYRIIGTDSFPGKITGTCITLLGLAIGEYIPFIWMQDAYLELYSANTFGSLPVLQYAINVTSVPVMFILLAATVACTILGCFWGKRIVERNFKKSVAK
nr:MptD family putative ECF transporter S component [uncultured Anaerocolumna sp.]